MFPANFHSLIPPTKLTRQRRTNPNFYYRCEIMSLVNAYFKLVERILIEQRSIL